MADRTLFIIQIFHGILSIVFFLFAAGSFTTTGPYTGLVPDAGSRAMANAIFVFVTTALWAQLVHHAAKLRALRIAPRNHGGHELNLLIFFFVVAMTRVTYLLLKVLYNAVGKVIFVRFVCWSILELVDHAGFFFAYVAAAVELAYVLLLCAVFGATSCPTLLNLFFTSVYLYVSIMFTDHP